MIACRHNGQSRTIPACIFVNRARSLSNVIGPLESGQAKQQELFAVWRYLAKLLRIFHMRGRYLRDVTHDNVVQVSIGNSHGWSLLEFARVAKDKRDIEKDTVPARTVPPEVRSPTCSASWLC